MSESVVAGPLLSDPQHYRLTLGTSPSRVESFFPANGSLKTRMFRVCNKHSSRFLAYTTTARGASAPTITASAADSVNADEGTPIPPLAVERIAVGSDKDLWLVASAASTPCQVTEYDENVR